MSFENKGSIPVTFFVTRDPDRSGNLWCNGTADEIEIQAAIDYITSIGGNKLHLGYGDYTLNRQAGENFALNILTSDFELGGEGELILANGQATVATPCHVVQVGNGADSFENVKITDIRIDGNRANQEALTASHGVFFNINVTYSQVRDCTLENTAFQGIRIEESDRSLVTNNKLIGCGEGVHFFTSDYCIADTNELYNTFYQDALEVSNGIHCIFSNNIVDTCAQSGIDIFGNSLNTIAIGNQIRNFAIDNDVGIGVTAGSVGTIVIGNNLHTSTRSGIVAFGRCSIIGNTVNGTLNGITARGEDITVDDNIVLNTSAIGIQCGDGSQVYNRLIIANNKIRDAATQNLVIYGIQYSLFEGNILHSSGATREMFISDYFGSGFNTMYNLITDNVLTTTLGWAIDESTNCGFNTIKDNLIDGATTAGIRIRGQSNKVYDNDFYNCALCLDDQGTGTTLRSIKGEFNQYGGGSAGRVAPVINTSPGGIDIDGNDEFVDMRIPLGREIQQVVRIAIWAYSNVVEADYMRLRIVAHGATGSEQWNLNPIDVINHPSEDNALAINDVVHWLIDAGDDAQIGTLVASDFVELLAVGEVAGNGDCATDGLFGGWEIEYV